MNELAGLLRNAIVSTLDDQAPWKTFRVGKRRTPWLSDELRWRMKHRYSLYRSAQRSEDVLAMAMYGIGMSLALTCGTLRIVTILGGLGV